VVMVGLGGKVAAEGVVVVEIVVGLGGRAVAAGSGEGASLVGVDLVGIVAALLFGLMDRRSIVGGAWYM
jgi:hypothetical protein